MICEEIHEIMQRELDGDLNEEERQKLYVHIEECAECHDCFQRLKYVSDQLHALPKVEPPHSIVDQLMPKLVEADQEFSRTSFEKHRSKRGIFTQKRYWIPSSIIAASLLFVALLNLKPSPDLNLTQELSVEENVEQDADTSGIYALDGESMLQNQPFEGELKTKGMDDDALIYDGESKDLTGEYSPAFDEVEHVSPNGTYTAIEGINGEYIKINKDNQPHYMTKTAWEAPWYLEEIEWLQDDELYFVLHHEGTDERQYWLIHIEERGGYEEQLDAPLSLDNEGVND